MKMMKRSITVMLALLVVVTVTSCRKRVLRGDGPQISETRQLAKFNEIVANGSVYITVVKDDEYKVVVTGYSSLIPQYETDVRGDRLILEYEDKYWNVKNDNIQVEVHTPYVDEVKLSGSGNMYIGSGYDQPSFIAEVSGSGDITLGDNFYERMDLEVNGSGNIDAENTKAQSVNARISGSGNIYTWVTDNLNVRISGSGDVFYKGRPSLSVDISGSGDVKRIN